MLRFISKSVRRLVAFASITLMLTGLAPVPGVEAQNSTSGTLTGQVFNDSGNPVARARVTVTNELNENKRATVTDDSGTYRVQFLPPGIYSIVASMEGYTGDPVSGFRIPLNATTPLRPPNITLRSTSSPAPVTPTPTPTPTVGTGQTTERTEFEALINTSDAARRGNFNERQVELLPLGGTTDMRTFDEFALLLPGVAPPPYTPGVRGPGVGFGIGTAGQFSVNGLRARSNNFSIDGSDNNDPDVGVRRQGFVALVPQSIESVQEFQISTLLWDAEQGRNFGSQVNAVSKDGGNNFHGQLHGFFSDSSLNARNFFDYTGGASEGENPFTRTQAGFVIGGPLVRNRTQFFAGYEFLSVNTSLEQQFATPTLDQRRFLGLEQFGVLQPFPGTSPLAVFATRRGATPLGLNVLSFYPEPNNPGGPYGFNNFSRVLPADGRGDVASFKVTHQFSQDTTFYARYNFTDDNRILPSVNRAIRSTIESDTRTQNLSLILTSAFSPTVINQARFSYGRTRLDFLESPGSPFLFQSSSIEEIGNLGTRTSQTGPIGELIVEPFSPIGVDVFSFPQNRANNTFQYADSISWTAGKHLAKFGADIRRVQLNSRIERNYRPRVVFGNGVFAFGAIDQSGDPPFPFVPASVDLLVLTGLQLATTGFPSSIFQTLTLGTPDPTIGLRTTEINLFFNDNWRVTNNFTLDYGLRYENNTVPREVNHRIERALRLEGIPTSGRSNADTGDRITAFERVLSAYREVTGDRGSIYQPDNNNVGPHVGFAWAPGTKGETAIRGGYGIYYDAILGAVVSQSRNVFPTEVPLNIAPGILPFDVLVLNNPAFLVLGDGRNGRPLPTAIPLIAPGTANQLGGTFNDFRALLGQFFRQTTPGFGGASDLTFTLPANDLATPYAQQWHLTIEQKLLNDYVLSAAYVGTKGTKLTRLTTPNLGPNVTPFIPVATGASIGGRPPVPFPPGTPPAIVLSVQPVRPRRPIPALGAFQRFENSAASNYHALQVEGRKRFSRGYQFTASYTWSHAIDDVSDVFPIAGASALPQNSFDLASERADANYDIRQRFAASLIYDLPFFRGSTGTAARVLGGWQLSSIFQAHTGQPFTLNGAFDVNLDGNLTDRPSTIDRLIFFKGHDRRKLALPEGSFPTEFFSFMEDGAVGRNTVRADSFINLDIALIKNFRFSDTQNLAFRAEAFNALNRANFGIPIRTIGSPGFGSAVDTVNPARTIQLALKYSF